MFEHFQDLCDARANFVTVYRERSLLHFLSSPRKVSRPILCPIFDLAFLYVISYSYSGSYVLTEIGCLMRLFDTKIVLKTVLQLWPDQGCQC